MTSTEQSISRDTAEKIDVLLAAVWDTETDSRLLYSVAAASVQLEEATDAAAGSDVIPLDLDGLYQAIKGGQHRAETRFMTDAASMLEEAANLAFRSM